MYHDEQPWPIAHQPLLLTRLPPVHSALPLQVFCEPLDQSTAPARLRSWAGAPRALAAYRNGDTNLASTYTQQLFKSQPTPPARALTYSIAAPERPGRGDVDSAREALGHATSMIRQNFPDARVGLLHDWLIPQLLSREARQLLDGDNETDKIDKTEDKWSQNNVRVTFAWFADRRSALHFSPGGCVHSRRRCSGGSSQYCPDCLR